MYWQVYLHKTSIASETMLKEYILRLKSLISTGNLEESGNSLLTQFFFDLKNGTINENNYLSRFTELDDVDVLTSLKVYKNHPDIILNYLSNSILNRRLFAINLQDTPILSDFESKIRQNIVHNLSFDEETCNSLVFRGQETTQAYNNFKQNIKVLKKDGQVKPLSDLLNLWINVKKVTKFYLCYPRIIE